MEGLAPGVFPEPRLVPGRARAAAVAPHRGRVRPQGGRVPPQAELQRVLHALLQDAGACDGGGRCGSGAAASAAVPLPTASQAVARPLGTSPQCVICMDRESQLVLPCAHSFCEACLWAWSVRSRTCPLCRARTRNQVRECFFLAESPTAKELTENIERYLDVTGKPVMSDPKKQSPQG
eukprot:CAMPEP_0177664526 /NCGR_PEP_ID=MMETSP0447-20121125/20543_1 /TAXON_ID=0 /ORGANISM="Stygamoeba regulata, Strain BSH-02190019" /LENGTH=178 /DNA_ID=CAMNT_0019170509 /DNA_START=304 /DNA_END=840 /DNA_ORIENTATION=+